MSCHVDFWLLSWLISFFSKKISYRNQYSNAAGSTYFWLKAHFTVKIYSFVYWPHAIKTTQNGKIVNLFDQNRVDSWLKGVTGWMKLFTKITIIIVNCSLHPNKYRLLEKIKCCIVVVCVEVVITENHYMAYYFSSHRQPPWNNSCLLNWRPIDLYNIHPYQVFRYAYIQIRLMFIWFAVGNFKLFVIRTRVYKRAHMYLFNRKQ